MKKIVFFDFDNTLYSHRTGKVPSSARKALEELRSCGHFLVLATGRGLESRVMVDAETAFVFDAYIFLNGQVVIENEAVVFERHIGMENTSRVFNLADSLDIAYGGFTGIGQALNRLNPRVQAVWDDFISDMPPVIPSFRDIEKIYLLQLYIEESEEPLFKDILDDYVTNRPHRYMLSLIPKAAGKSLGMRFLMEEHGFAKADSYAFGDGYNDADMLQAAGCGIAMADGSEELKAVADIVCPSADDDGIARTVKALGLN